MAPSCTGEYLMNLVWRSIEGGGRDPFDSQRIPALGTGPLDIITADGSEGMPAVYMRVAGLLPKSLKGGGAVS